MTPTRPYLIRAFYEWIVDNDCTPHIVVNADGTGCEVPTEYVESGQIVLNVAMTAVQSLLLGNDAISFQARFDGVSHHIYIPINTVMAIYAKENGRGMVFAEDDTEPPPTKTKSAKTSAAGKKGKGGKRTGGGSKPHLTVVK